MKLNNISVADLQKELARREKGVTKLHAKRDKLLAQIADIDKELAALGVATQGKKGRGGLAKTTSRTRPKNDMNLPDAIAAAMEVRAQVSPKEAAELVLSNGYKTTSKTFAVQVANALTKDPRFKRVERGTYERVK